MTKAAALTRVSNAGNWSPDGCPNWRMTSSSATWLVRRGDTTILDLSFTIASLTLSNGADVDTSGNRLTVNGVTTLGGAGTSILVRLQHADLEGP